MKERLSHDPEENGYRTLAFARWGAVGLRGTMHDVPQPTQEQPAGERPLVDRIISGEIVVTREQPLVLPAPVEQAS